jgi:hypothetical protein
MAASRIVELGSLARMTYFADLTLYLYGLPEPEQDVLNVGWLDVVYPFPRGETPLIPRQSALPSAGYLEATLGHEWSSR